MGNETTRHVHLTSTATARLLGQVRPSSSRRRPICTAIRISRLRATGAPGDGGCRAEDRAVEGRLRGVGPRWSPDRELHRVRAGQAEGVPFRLGGPCARNRVERWSSKTSSTERQPRPCRPSCLAVAASHPIPSIHHTGSFSSYTQSNLLHLTSSTKHPHAHTFNMPKTFNKVVFKVSAPASRQLNSAASGRDSCD